MWQIIIFLLILYAFGGLAMDFQWFDWIIATLIYAVFIHSVLPARKQEENFKDLITFPIILASFMMIIVYAMISLYLIEWAWWIVPVIGVGLNYINKVRREIEKN